MNQNHDISDVLDEYGDTALGVAISKNQIEAFKYAVKKNINSGCFDFYKTNGQKQGVLEMVWGLDRGRMIEGLLQAGYDVRRERVNTIWAKMAKKNKKCGIGKMVRKERRQRTRKEIAGTWKTNGAIKEKTTVIEIARNRNNEYDQLMDRQAIFANKQSQTKLLL